MDYKIQAAKLLKQLGIYNIYKGCDIIISCISFIQDNKSSYYPITKVLYTEIAKQYNTSNQCVEKNIRKVIDCIWKTDKNKEIIQQIFGLDISHKPSNTEFLLSLYNHIESHGYAEQLYNINKDKIEYICPLNQRPCSFCNEILHQIVQKICT